MADHDHDHDQPSPCEQALAELYTFLDGELTDAKRSAIASHLESCNPCVEIFDFEAELRIVVSTRAVEEVPDALRLRITQTLTALATDDTGGDAPAAAF
ncbi:MAG: mycothiol system anti-sigma-R factor [Acidimicrobiales bacterium]|jgi:mycothiol system anti-sigma-R factor|nr:mycothiol system anti-sigma-R factor [Acidimicrobiales bacterium]